MSEEKLRNLAVTRDQLNHSVIFLSVIEDVHIPSFC